MGYLTVVEIKMCTVALCLASVTVCVRLAEPERELQPADRLDAESHSLLLFDVLRSDRMWQWDDGFLLCISGQSFPHVCNKKHQFSAAGRGTAPAAAHCYTDTTVS